MNTGDGDLSDAEDGLGQAICIQQAGTLQEFEDDSQPLPSEPFWDGEDDEELTNEEVDIMAQAVQLAMDWDEEVDNMNGESDEDSETQSESESEGSGSNFDYVPNKIHGRCRHHRTVSTKNTACKVPKPNKTVKNTMKEYTSQRGPIYEFCPLPHHLSIIQLLAKHFCQHPLLPEHHGQPWSSEQIHDDAVYEAYLHCKNNQLYEVWAYLWTNWYTPEKWRLCV